MPYSRFERAQEKKSNDNANDGAGPTCSLFQVIRRVRFPMIVGVCILLINVDYNTIRAVGCATER